MAALRRLLRPHSEIVTADDRLMTAMAPWLREQDRDEVLNFERLVGKVGRILRMPSRPLATPEALKIAIESACAKLPETSRFHPLAAAPGAQRAIDRTIRELRHAGYQPEHLRFAANNSRPAMAENLSELADIWDAVRVDLERVGMVFATDFARTQMENREPIGPVLTHLLVVGGQAYEPLYGDYLLWLAERGVEIDFIADGLPGREDLFHPTRWMANRLGAPVEENPALGGWYQDLFAREPQAKDPIEVSIWRSPEMLTECEWAIRATFRAQSQGIPRERIAIVVRDTEAYFPMLSYAARLHHADLSVLHRVPLASNGFVAMILGLLDALASPDPRRLSNAIRSSYAGLSAEERAAALQALLSLQGKRVDPWELLRETLAALGEVGAKVLGWVEWRKACLAESLRLAGWLDRLRLLMISEPFGEQIISPENPTADRDLRAKNRLESTLASLAGPFDVIHDRPVSLREFAGLLRKKIDEQDLSVPAPRNTGIQVVEDVAKLDEVDVVLGLGMLEGSMPRRRSEDPVLNDEAREVLRNAAPEIPALMTSHEVARTERDAFVTLCASARKQLILSYPATDEERDNTPAFYLHELGRALGDRMRPAPRETEQTVPAKDYIVTAHDDLMRRALESERITPAAPQLESEAAREEIRTDWLEPVDPAALARAYACEFQYLARDRLRLWTSPQLMARSRLPRAARAAQLPVQPDEEAIRDALGKELQLESDRQFTQSEYLEWSLFDRAANRLGEAWVRRELTFREKYGTDPTRNRADFRLGQCKTSDTLEIGGKQIMLRIGDAGLTVIPLRRDGDPKQAAGLFTFYRSSAPELKTDREKYPDEWANFVITYGLPLLLTESWKMQGVLFHTLEKSTAYLLRPQAGVQQDLKKDRDEAIEFKWANLDLIELRDALDPILRSVYQRVDQRTMRASPGIACERCDFGELCRMSSVFGDEAQGDEEE